jgi:6-phosphogluconolactonase
MIGEVRVSDNPAAELAAELTELIKAAEAPAIAVSGGSTPRKLFRILAQEFREGVPWDRVRIFQVDERCVPPDHADSNWKMLQEELLSALPQVRAFRMEAERPGAAEDYEALIRHELPPGDHGLPAFDVILLGMGSDGHTASIFPATPAEHETAKLVMRNAVPQLDTERLTLTLPLLLAAKNRWFLVTGADKAEAFAIARDRGNPAGRVGPSTWFIDPTVAASESP